MLNLLNVKVTGYRLLKDNFEINLTNRTKVFDEDLDKECFTIDKSVYGFRTVSLVGANSSGKSTVLCLLLNVYNYLKDGRWAYSPLDFKKDKISLQIMFYLNDYIYLYSVNLKKNDSDSLSRSRFCFIDNETLKMVKFDKNKGSANLKRFNENDSEITDVSDKWLSKSMEDTSSLFMLTKNDVLVDEFSINTLSNFQETIVRNSFFELLKSADPVLSAEVLKLLDEGIEYVTVENNELVHLKRTGEDEMVIPKNSLLLMLSGGTFRGYELYIRAALALKYGKVFIVDEIENCFQKNLVNNLLILFNDGKTNPSNAQLIFSTHYVETLDTINRRDNILITHKKDNRIYLNNMLDYNIRPDKIKSIQLNNNSFDTSANYDQLMKVRRLIING